MTNTDEPDYEDVGFSPLERLGLLAVQSHAVTPDLVHHELYTQNGLTTLFWHGPNDATEVAIAVGGAMGGVLGPDGGVYPRLASALADQGRGMIRVGYRRPGRTDRCVEDVMAAMELALQAGAERFVLIGHSFGGAVVVGAAARTRAAVAPGVVTLATQSGDCEPAEYLGDRNLLLLHGTADDILPPASSEMVRFLAGTGELELIDGADHLFRPMGDAVLALLVERIPVMFEPPSG